jgi:hypothetical protein
MFAKRSRGKLTLLIETKVILLSEVEVSAIEMFASTPLGQLILLIEAKLSLLSEVEVSLFETEVRIKSS